MTTRRALKKAPARPGLDRKINEARASARLAKDAEAAARAFEQQTARVAELEAANADLGKRLETAQAANVKSSDLIAQIASLRRSNAWLMRQLAEAEARLDSRDEKRRLTILGLAAALAEERNSNDEREVSDDADDAGVRHDHLQARKTAEADGRQKQPAPTSDPSGFDLSFLD